MAMRPTSPTPLNPLRKFGETAILLNGIAPGFATDVINAGAVIVLNNPIDTTAAPTTPYPYSGGDKFAASKTVAVTRTGWATGPNTLLAGTWKCSTRTTGEQSIVCRSETNIPDSDDSQKFEYTGLAIIRRRTRCDVQP